MVRGLFRGGVSSRLVAVLPSCASRGQGPVASPNGVCSWVRRGGRDLPRPLGRLLLSTISETAMWQSNCELKPLEGLWSVKPWCTLCNNGRRTCALGCSRPKKTVLPQDHVKPGSVGGLAVITGPCALPLQHPLGCAMEKVFHFDTTPDLRPFGTAQQRI